MRRPEAALSHRQAVIARITVALLSVIVLTIPVAPMTVAQTPEANGTPQALSFRLVAQVAAEEWSALETAPATPQAGDELAGPELLVALREGGFVIYFRHARTDFSQSDSDPIDLANCATQRNLSAEGRAQARLIGDSIDALRIPIGEVLSSELCRTRETAELAFGRVTPMRDLTSYRTARSRAEEQARIEALRRLLATPPAPGTNTVLVGHGFNIGNAAGIGLGEREAAFFQPLGTAEVPATPPT